MVQLPIIQMIYLDGVVAAFAVFALTLLAISLYTHRQPHHGAAKTVAKAEHEVIVVRGVRPLYF